MNFLSLNIRGVVGPEKPGWVRRLKRESPFSFLAIQESHQESVPEPLVRRFWDRSPFSFEFVGSVGRSGGILSVWNSDLFSVDSTVKNQGFLLVSGALSGVVSRVNVLNVYAPRDPGSRRRLWGEILAVKEQYDGLWVTLGDFNEVRWAEERVNSRFDVNAAVEFNEFIGRAGFLEYHMIGGSFTYMSDNGVKLSKLDRVLVCHEFMSMWPNATLEVLRRGYSDHRPLLLACENSDYGPIPFKLFNSWVGKKELDDIVRRNVSLVLGNLKGDYLLAKLLKNIKADYLLAKLLKNIKP